MLEDLQAQIQLLPASQQQELRDWLEAQLRPVPTQDRPGRWFRYLGTAGIEGLKKQELMCSKPTDTNDPFEYLTALTTALPEVHWPESAMRTQVAEYWQRLCAKNSFVVCLSEAEHNVRMWAQYAENHQGLMLELDFTQGTLRGLWDSRRLQRVDYGRGKRLDIPKLVAAGGLTGQHVQQLATHKGIDWEHEREWRLFLSREDDCAPDRHSRPSSGRLAYLDFLNHSIKAFLHIEDACIRKVVLGYRSTPRLMEAVLEIKRQRAAPWTVAKARLSLDSFCLDEEVIEA